jgi:hypothetical protein
MSVSTAPGATALIRIPRSPSAPSFRLRVSENIFDATARTRFARTAWPRTVMRGGGPRCRPRARPRPYTLRWRADLVFDHCPVGDLRAIGLFREMLVFRSMGAPVGIGPDREALFTAADPVIDQERSRAHCIASCRSEDAHPEPGQVRIPYVGAPVAGAACFFNQVSDILRAMT